MTVFSLLPFVAGGFSLLLAGLSLVRRKPSPATWCFFAGMVALAIDSVLFGLALRATGLGDLVYWLGAAFIAKSVLPVIWLSFSLTYSRTEYREFLGRWKVPLAAVGVLPIGLCFLFRDQLLQVSPDAAGEVLRLQFGAIAKALNAILLVAFVLIVMNLEQTFRAAVGTARWRIKLVVLALVVIFGTRLYVGSQAILFSAPDIALWGLESAALLIGCVFLAVAYARTGWAEIDVYPSSAVLRSSLTVLIVGGYLLIVGVLAQVVRRFGGVDFFQVQGIIVLLGMAGMALLLLSDRARQRIHAFVVRHFRKAQYDSVRIWTLFSQHLGNVTDRTGLCTASAKLISETFDVLSVTVWLLDPDREQLTLRASTSGDGRREDENTASPAVAAGLADTRAPFDLEGAGGPWAHEFRRLNEATFPNGGRRVCVPLQAGERMLGALVLADRVNGTVYTVEELELLQCIADHIGSVLVNLRLGAEVARARELEAFRTMSAFFVHDLKNAAASLNLLVRNLPAHFEDPAFRHDALKGLTNTATRMDDLIARLTALRERPEAIRVPADLNQLVADALTGVGSSGAPVVRELQPVPPILADPDQVRSLVTNLVLNAQDALGPDGRIQVRTEHRSGCAVLSVADNGCGMDADFVKTSLFRPFRSTKRKGLGIGLYQCRAIVQAHGGAMQVESEPGKGTTFFASFPVRAGR